MGPCHISYINYVFVDLGSWTLLFRQPVAALQIQNHRTLEWKWAKPQDATLTVNASDALSLLTGGYRSGRRAAAGRLEAPFPTGGGLNPLQTT